LVGRQLQEGIVLVVAEEDVVLWRPLLDQVVLEGERLDDRVGDDELEPCHLIQKRIGLRVGAVGAEIIAHAIAERARFSDVNRVATRVEVQIYARLLRQPCNLLLEFVDGHTVLWRVFDPCLNPPLYATRPTPSFGSARRSPARSAPSACSRSGRSSTSASGC